MQKFEWAFFVIGSDWFNLRPDSAFYTGLCPKPRGSRPCRICLRQIHGLRRTADAVLLHLRHLLRK